MPNWYWEKKDLRNTPSQNKGMDFDTGNSFSVQRNILAIKPKYDKRLLAQLHVNYTFRTCCLH